MGSISPYPKRCCEQTFKNNDALIHLPSLALPSPPDKFLSRSRDRFWLGVHFRYFLWY